MKECFETPDHIHRAGIFTLAGDIHMISLPIWWAMFFWGKEVWIVILWIQFCGIMTTYCNGLCLTNK